MVEKLGRGGEREKKENFEVVDLSGRRFLWKNIWIFCGWNSVFFFSLNRFFFKYFFLFWFINNSLFLGNNTGISFGCAARVFLADGFQVLQLGGRRNGRMRLVGGHGRRIRRQRNPPSTSQGWAEIILDFRLG